MKNPVTPWLVVLAALSVLIILAMRADAAETIPEYDRSAFPHWQTRQCRAANHDALARWATEPVEWRTDRECRIANDTGQWTGPYGGQTFGHYRDLDVDHVIPLAWAWEHGAWEWTRDRRREFANDPANLIPVSARLNRQKGARGPTEWLPPVEAYRCEYMLRWHRVLQKYGLPVTGGIEGLTVSYCDK